MDSVSEPSVEPLSSDFGLQTFGVLEMAVKSLAAQSDRFDWVGIYLLNDDVLELGPYVGEAPEHTRIPVGEGVCGVAVKLNCDQNVPNVKECSHYLACSLATKSELVVLIKNQLGQTVGIIDIDSDMPDAFGEEEVSLVKRVSKELGEVWSG